MNRPAPGLTDSPWFWGAAFCLGGLAALAAGSRVYDARQDRIERRFQVRRQVGLPTSVAGAPGAQAAEGVGAAIQIDPRRQVPIRPLVVLCVLGAVVCTGMLIRSRRAAPASTTAENPP